MWLRVNEGDEGGEREACVAVADWIEHQNRERLLRLASRSARVPVAKLRERLGGK